MWKTIVLCASLFAGCAAALAAGARWVEPSALPTAGAIAVCLVGIVLILAAPAKRLDERPPLRSVPPPAHAAPRLEAAVSEAKTAATPIAITGPHPSLH